VRESGRVPAGVPFRDDSVAFAKNWKIVVGVDVAMGAIVLAVGVIVGVAVAWWGWPMAALGSVYVFFAGGRVVRFRRLRREAGL
jgi:hypothetical protein